MNEVTSIHSDRRVLIQKIADIKTLPTTLIKILEVSKDPRSSAKDLTAIISQDQSISSMLLKVVNSAFYGSMRRVTSISQAVVILGFRTVKALAMSVSVFQSPGNIDSSFDRNRFWVHSIGVAMLSQSLYGTCKKKGSLTRDEAYLGGLLHDLGKVVFDNYFTEEYQTVLSDASENKRWIGDSELELLQMRHTEAGYYLANKWNLPKSVVEGIKYHHSPNTLNSPHIAMIAIVHCADYFCREMKLGYGGDEQMVPLETRILDLAGISSSSIKKSLAELELMRDQIESFTLDA